MSEVLSHESNDKPFLKTEADIADSLHDQVDVASTGEELLDDRHSPLPQCFASAHVRPTPTSAGHHQPPRRS